MSNGKYLQVATIFTRITQAKKSRLEILGNEDDVDVLIPGLKSTLIGFDIRMF